MPNRLRCILGLDAKNPAIVLEDADLDCAVAECVTGSLSFNGQRCTALKLLFVHRAVAESFVAKLAAAVDALPFGMPWQKGVRITPLPSLDRVARMQALVADAQGKGARIANRQGGLTNATFYFPSVVYPVTPAMDLYSVEQFGPVVPVAVFDDVREVFAAVVASNYGQQASIFGTDPARLGPLIDALANQVCRVNLNAQCQRGPDVYPFARAQGQRRGDPFGLRRPALLFHQVHGGSAGHPCKYRPSSGHREGTDIELREHRLSVLKVGRLTALSVRPAVPLQTDRRGTRGPGRARGGGRSPKWRGRRRGRSRHG